MASARKALKEAFDSRKYLIAVTFIDPKTGLREHRIETNAFPVEDIIGSFDEMKKLALKGAATAIGGVQGPGTPIVKLVPEPGGRE